MGLVSSGVAAGAGGRSGPGLLISGLLISGLLVRDLLVRGLVVG
jgi:hypothetical protein